MKNHPADDFSITDIPTLLKEITRLRIALSHLTTHARAVIECRDNGGLTLAAHGYPAYQASHALAALEACTTRALSGDWQPITRAHIAQAWDRHAKRPLWGEEYLPRDRWHSAINDLLWHPERQFPHPPHRQCGCMECTPSFEADMRDNRTGIKK